MNTKFKEIKKLYSGLGKWTKSFIKTVSFCFFALLSFSVFIYIYSTASNNYDLFFKEAEILDAAKSVLGTGLFGTAILSAAEREQWGGQ